MIDVVYTIGRSCAWGDYDELRYSLRSLDLFDDIGQVFIVGHKPEWVKNVIHLPLSDPYKHNKDANLNNKIVLACCDPRLSDRFIFMSDDQYFLRKTKVDDFKPVAVNTLHKPQSKDQWNKRMTRTLKFLAQRGHSTDVFEAHCPYLLEKAKYPSVVLDYCFGEAVGMCGNTLYFNSLGVKAEPNNNYVTGSHRKHTASELLERTKNVRFLNINHGVSEVHQEFLKNKFPEKSRFE